MDKKAKDKLEQNMRRYDPNFVAHEIAIHKHSKEVGFITMENLAGVFIDIKMDGYTIRAHWSIGDYIPFVTEQEYLAYRLKHG